MPPVLTVPLTPAPPASNARLLYNQQRLEETVAFCQKELPLIEKEVPNRSQKVPQNEDALSPTYQYFALTAILVDSLAQLGRWKAAKETLGRYRMRFPRDPWGYEAGAEVTRLDPEVKDREAVEEAAELLEEEARRIQSRSVAKRKSR